MADHAKQPGKAEDDALELEKEYEAWDWARTSGVAPDELRKALQEQIRLRQRR
jgi:hypothetical protein